MVTPRSTIPEAWAEKGCCPFCQAARLRVQHAPATADQLTCGGCGAAFELELSGPRLRLMAAPAGRNLPATAQTWLSVAEARALLQSALPSEALRGEAAASAAPAPPEAPSPLPSAVEAAAQPLPAAGPSRLATCDPAELLTRAEALLALGNSPIQIQVALVQSGVAPEQVQAVMDAVRRLAHAKRERQIRMAWLFSGVVVVLAVAVAGAGFWITRGADSPPPTTPLASALPPTPTGVVGFLLSQPTPVVRTELPQAAGEPRRQCPTLPADAAVLFGGLTADWTFKPDVSGWIMTSVTPRDIYVPAGMQAGYFEIVATGANITNVEGPATIQRVNFVAITCP